MQNTFDTDFYISFFKKELTEELLFFWMDKCLDTKNGGYFNCFSNDGDVLLSTDKYTWSEGRFLWIFSRLATMKSDLFGKAERERFLQYAKSGRDFLLEHVLVGKDDFRCVFLMQADGMPKAIDGHEGYDLSISADCFVVMGFAAYACAAEDEEAFSFAKALGESVLARYYSDSYRSLPYPVSSRYRAHARPMLLSNMCCELYRAAERFDEAFLPVLRTELSSCRREIFEDFADEEDLIHEFCHRDGGFTDDLFTQHINPGHTLEDMWFQCEVSDILHSDRYEEKIARIAKKTFLHGWDDVYGGLFHFIPCDGLETRFSAAEAANESQMPLILGDWGSKLWWVHSEAMYTTLLLYFRTHDDQFLTFFRKIFDYTYKTFPNPDRTVREWIQIRTREGKPQNKVVALPVKDPYHIMRNVLLIIELLEREKNSTEKGCTLI